ncbi:MAG: phosphotransferase [Nitrospirae bacterium]|nr:phosphotransferase [Nitrospirota bacterium]
MKPINAFILAAGHGERLRPITSHIPKPLLPVLGVPVIEKIIEKVIMTPVKKIGINMHYKWEMIQKWANESQYADKIDLFIENQILGTGGALKNAKSFLSDTVFLLHNADIISNICLEELIRGHFESGNTVTLAVHDYQGFNNVWIDSNNRLVYVGDQTRKDQKGLRAVAFTGISVYSPDVIDFLPDGASGLVDAWLRAVSSGHTVGTLDFTGCEWTDIGTPEAYSSFIFEALRKEGENIFVNPSVDCSKIDMAGYVVIEKDSILEGTSSLRNCILLPGALIANNSKIYNAILGPEYLVHLEEKLTSPPAGMTSSLIADYFDEKSEDITITGIGSGGSDRNYYRISSAKKSVILMESSHSLSDYERHLAYTEFFRKNNLPVPELIGFETSDCLAPDWVSRENEDRLLALFEDLGDLSLYSWLKCRRSEDIIERMYNRIVDIVAYLHSTVSNNATYCLLLQSRVFDYDHLRWETDYFMENFVKGLCGIAVAEFEAQLLQEFYALAIKVDSFKKSIVHRDLQSQNIMITKGDPRIIDYQGARIGPPAYDVASLLWDPYYRLEDALRERLIEHYIARMKEYSDMSFHEDEIRQTMLFCRLQRHMQALGAYGFLSRVKGKKYFLKYTPQALSYLKEEAELTKAEYPVLYELLKIIHEKACR